MTLNITPPLEDRAPLSDDAILSDARESMRQEAAAIGDVAARLDGSYCRAVRLLFQCKGRVFVCGIGKSGHVGRKIAATLCCGGTPAYFLHPGEAAHGDLGGLTSRDIVVAISKSGESQEITRLVPYFRELGVPVVALVGQQECTLAKWADVVVDVPVAAEACPLGLVPTTSALATLAVADAMAGSLMRLREFTAEEFARLHPGGHLGRGLNRRVRNVMQSDNLPLVSLDKSVGEVLPIMTRGTCGLAIVVDSSQSLLGIVTDGDLRRAMACRRDLFQVPVSEIMTRDPVTVHEDATALEAQQRMRRLQLRAFIVLNAQNRVTGVVQIFDGT